MNEIGLLGVFAAGALTVFTPCVLPMLPVYLSILVGGAGAAGVGRAGRLGLLARAALFAAGFIAVFSLMGLTVTAAGAFLVRNRVYLSLFGGLLVVLFGLRFVGWLRVGFLEREARLGTGRLTTRLWWADALLLGVVFALGWTPCIGPVLGAVLTFAASRSASLAGGALSLALYGLGMSLPLLLLAAAAGGAAPLARRLTRWLPALERATGVLLVGAGLYMMADAVGAPAPRKEEAVRLAGAAPAGPVDPPVGAPAKTPRLVEFYSEDCAVCRSMIPVVSALQRECGAKGVEVVRVDVGEGGGELRARFAIRGVPTFVFLDAQGRETARLIGYQTPGALTQAMAALIGDGRCDGVGLLPEAKEAAPPPPPPGQAGASCGS